MKLRIFSALLLLAVGVANVVDWGFTAGGKDKLVYGCIFLVVSLIMAVGLFRQKTTQK